MGRPSRLLATLHRRLEGRAKLVYQDGGFLDGFFKGGVLHGFAR